MRIVLYAAVSHESVGEVFEQSPVTAVRRAIRRQVDRLLWRFGDRFVAHPYHYLRKHYSNLGDEAIRFTIERQFRDALPKDVEFEDLAWGRLDRTVAARYDDGRTVIIITGGGYYRFASNGDIHPHVVEDVEAMRNVRCPVISYGAGVNFNILPDGPSEFTPSKRAEEVLAEHFRQTSYCAVRDRYSQGVLQPFAERPIDVIADPVFFLEPVPTPRPRRGGLRVGVNLAFHGPNAMAVLAVWIHQLRDLLKSIRRRHKAQFTYFVHSDTEHGIVALLRDSGIEMDVVASDPEGLANAYADIDVHICQMMHSSIMSTRLGVPTLVIAYDRKHYSFFDLLGLPKFCIPVEEASLANLESLFDEMVMRKDEIRSHLAVRRNELSGPQRDSLLAVGHVARELPQRSISPR